MEEEVTEEETPDNEDSVTLRPNRFRPKAGSRNRVRTVLHQALKDETTVEDEEGQRYGI